MLEIGIDPGHAMEQIIERASELDHLIEPVFEELLRGLQETQTEDNMAHPFDWVDKVTTSLSEEYFKEGLLGRLFVLGTIGPMIAEQLEDPE